MKIFPVKAIAEIDYYTVQCEPVLSINLMERAAQKIFTELQKRYAGRKFLILAGPGNNGGDALAVARMLLLNGFNVTVVLLQSEGLSDDTAVNMERLRHFRHVKIVVWNEDGQLPSVDSSCVIVDGLFGTGLSRPLTGKALNLVQKINSMEAEVVAIDIPSGLMGENNEANNTEGIICASITFTLQFPKLAFMFAENHRYVGRWEVLDIGLDREKIADTKTCWSVTEACEVQSVIPPRNRFDHKGMFGHSLLIAGRCGMMGAAVLASSACMRSGAGLLTVHVPQNQSGIIHSTVPEAITSIDRSELIFTGFPDLTRFSAIGIGPAIGRHRNTAMALAVLLEQTGGKPLVMDADAINIIAQNSNLIEKLPQSTILTPHPKEFQRLAGTWNSDYGRLLLAVDFCKKHSVIIVLKGAFTAVILEDGTCHFNPVGNPGMATAGSGDVLTGIILALLSRGLLPRDAAVAGTYLHGLAGDMAAEKNGEESLIASDIVANIGNAFRQLRNSSIV